MLYNDFQYFATTKEGTFFIDTLPMLALPGSYIFMNNKKFLVTEYAQPVGNEADEIDICVYCEEVDNDVDIISLQRELKINKILNPVICPFTNEEL